MEPRAKFLHESRKTAVRQEAVPDMEDSPPVSDSDVSPGGLLPAGVGELSGEAHAAALSGAWPWRSSCRRHVTGCLRLSPRWGEVAQSVFPVGVLK